MVQSSRCKLGVACGTISCLGVPCAALICSKSESSSAVHLPAPLLARTMAKRHTPADVHAGDDSATPRTLNVLEFAQARAREIELLTSTMDNAGGNRRVFQTLPRHLRRRSMSHNIYRIPYRLRASAKREMDKMAGKPKEEKKGGGGDDKDDDEPAAVRGNRRKRRRPKFALESHARRQKKHRWLETHIWHAKRMHMVDVWGYRLAEFPNDKSTRYSFKAAQHLATLYDASYTAAIELRGSQQALVKLVDRHRDAKDAAAAPSNQLFLEGGRQGSFVLHHTDRFPLGAVAPVSFHWLAGSFAAPRAAESKQQPKKSSGKGGKAAAGSGTGTGTEPERALWVWVHAAVYEEVLAMLQAVAQAGGVRVRSLREELVRFELTGARSHSVLCQVLRPLAAEPAAAAWRAMARVGAEAADAGLSGSATSGGSSGSAVDRAHKVWSTLRTLRSPASLPAGTVLSLPAVADPRTFSPRQPFTSGVKPRDVEDKQRAASEAESAELIALLLSWPSPADIAQSPLFNETARAAQRKYATLKMTPLRGKRAAVLPSASSMEEGSDGSDDDGGSKPAPGDAKRQPKQEGKAAGKPQPKKGSLKPTGGSKSDSEVGKGVRFGAASAAGAGASSSAAAAMDTSEDKSGAGGAGSSGDVAGCASVLLLQRPGSDDPSTGGSGLGSGWDLVISAEWGRSFWKALVYAGARAVGLRDRRRFLHEQGFASFPEDYPDTAAGRMWEDHTGTQSRDAWDRKPAGKRVNFHKLRVDSPFQPDWCGVLGLPDPHPSQNVFCVPGLDRPSQSEKKRNKKQAKAQAKAAAAASAAESKRAAEADDADAQERPTKRARKGSAKGSESEASEKKSSAKGTSKAKAKTKGSSKGPAKGSASADEATEPSKRARLPRLQKVPLRQTRSASAAAAAAEQAPIVLPFAVLRDLPRRLTASETKSSASASSALPRDWFASRRLDPLLLSSARCARSLVRVWLSMASRGTPEPLAAVCLPTADDFAAFVRVGKRWQPDEEPVRLTEQQLAAQQAAGTGAGAGAASAGGSRMGSGKEAKSDAPSSSSQQQPPIRRVIGFVTNGLFSFLKGKGKAGGFCSAAAVAEAFRVCSPRTADAAQLASSSASVTSVSGDGRQVVLGAGSSPAVASSPASRVDHAPRDVLRLMAEKGYALVLLRNTTSRLYMPAFLKLVVE